MLKVLLPLLLFVALLAGCAAPEPYEAQVYKVPSPDWINEQVQGIAVPAVVTIGSSMNVGEAAEGDVPYYENKPVTILLPIYNAKDDWAVVQINYKEQLNGYHEYKQVEADGWVTVIDDGDGVIAIPAKRQKYATVTLLVPSDVRPPDKWAFGITATDLTSKDSPVLYASSTTVLVDMR